MSWGIYNMYNSEIWEDDSLKGGSDLMSQTIVRFFRCSVSGRRNGVQCIKSQGCILKSLAYHEK